MSFASNTKPYIGYHQRSVVSAKKEMVYWGTTVDDCTNRCAVAFAVSCDSEESAKVGHLGEKEREMVVETKREGEKPLWFLYKHPLYPACIRRENGVEGRSQTGR